MRKEICGGVSVCEGGQYEFAVLSNPHMHTLTPSVTTRCESQPAWLYSTAGTGGYWEEGCGRSEGLWL